MFGHLEWLCGRSWPCARSSRTPSSLTSRSLKTLANSFGIKASRWEWVWLLESLSLLLFYKLLLLYLLLPGVPAQAPLLSWHSLQRPDAHLLEEKRQAEAELSGDARSVAGEHVSIAELICKLSAMNCLFQTYVTNLGMGVYRTALTARLHSVMFVYHTVHSCFDLFIIHFSFFMLLLCILLHFLMKICYKYLA